MTPQPSSERLVIRPVIGDDRPGLVTRVTARDAGWSLLNMEVRRLARGDTWQHDTGEHESAFVVLGGRCGIVSNRGQWPAVGRRRTVFDGMPYALYLPRRSTMTLTAASEQVEIAHCWVATTEDHAARLITPSDSEIELRGGGHASRQINTIIPPGFECHRIVAVEVYTPGGNWSSYPPHKHDVHREDAGGRVLEADLEEFYFYKVDRAAGFAIQRVYTADRGLDATVVARDNDIVLVPAGYHPVSAAHGYTCYYLNFLAGTAQSLANSDDPDHAWVKTAWGPRDPRVPVVTHAMER